MNINIINLFFLQNYEVNWNEYHRLQQQRQQLLEPQARQSSGGAGIGSLVRFPLK